MPRSLQEILDHADELARKLEDYEPSPDDEVDVAEYLLRRAALGRARSERQVAEAVAAARSAGLSWKHIGTQIGTSAQGAQQRYGQPKWSAGSTALVTKQGRTGYARMSGADRQIGGSSIGGTMPRKRQGSDTVHFCTNCSNWPTSNYIESNSGERCNECLAKRNAGTCSAG